MATALYVCQTCNLPIHGNEPTKVQSVEDKIFFFHIHCHVHWLCFTGEIHKIKQQLVAEEFQNELSLLQSTN